MDPSHRERSLVHGKTVVRLSPMWIVSRSNLAVLGREPHPVPGGAEIFQRGSARERAEASRRAVSAMALRRRSALAPAAVYWYASSTHLAMRWAVHMSPIPRQPTTLRLAACTSPEAPGVAWRAHVAGVPGAGGSGEPCNGGVPNALTSLETLGASCCPLQVSNYTDRL